MLKINKSSIAAVFIDVDLTLLNCASYRLFLKDRFIKSSAFHAIDLFKAYILRKIKYYTATEFKISTLQILKGLNKDEIEIIGKIFCKSILLHRLRAGGIKQIQECKRTNIPVYLASASPDIYIDELSRQLNMSGYFASELEYDDNQTFTGKYIDSECVSDNKANKVKKFCQMNNIDLMNSVFFSDSFQDVPLLSMVGFPAGVWPDRKLKQHCKMNNWPIEYW